MKYSKPNGFTTNIAKQIRFSKLKPTNAGDLPWIFRKLDAFDYMLEEMRYINMALDVLRGVNEQDKNSLIMNITSFHQHYQERRKIDQGCLEKLEKNIQRQREGDFKKA